MPDVPAPIPPQQPRFVTVSILVDPQRGPVSIDHKGIPRLAMVQILGQAVSLAMGVESVERAQAAAKRVEVAGAGALRELEPARA